MKRGCVCLVGMLLMALALATPAAAQSATVQVRVIHAAPDLAPVDVFVDNQRVVSGLGFPNVSQYISLPVGAHTLRLSAAGADSAAAVLTSDIALAAGKTYTVAAIGLNDISAQVFIDDLSAVPAGKARVRVIHTSPDAPSVDIETEAGATLFSNIGFGKASDYKLVDAATYNLRVVAEGNSTVFLQLPNTTFKAGVIYDIFAVGRLASLQTQVATAAPVAQPSSPQQMPVTGAGDNPAWLLASLGLLLLLGGAALRRKLGHS